METCYFDIGTRRKNRRKNQLSCHVSVATFPSPPPPHLELCVCTLRMYSVHVPEENTTRLLCLIRKATRTRFLNNNILKKKKATPCIFVWIDFCFIFPVCCVRWRSRPEKKKKCVNRGAPEKHGKKKGGIVIIDATGLRVIFGRIQVKTSSREERVASCFRHFKEATCLISLFFFLKKNFFWSYFSFLLSHFHLFLFFYVFVDLCISLSLSRPVLHSYPNSTCCFTSGLEEEEEGLSWPPSSFFSLFLSILFVCIYLLVVVSFFFFFFENKTGRARKKKKKRQDKKKVRKVKLILHFKISYSAQVFLFLWILSPRKFSLRPV